MTAGALETFDPKDCHFGIIDNYEPCFFSDGNVCVFISVFEADGVHARDDIYEEMLNDFPVWLKDRDESECNWAAPGGWTRPMIIEALTAMGYTHNPKWDGDYGA